MHKMRQPDESGTDRKQYRILVVEDEAIIAEDIQLSLNKLGYDVASIVVTGNEALEKAGTERPDLVLMDIMLAGNMDGIEAAYRIRDRFNIPVIYLTAYSDENILKRAGETASYGYLLKPFSERELYTTIETAINKHRMEKERDRLSRELEEKNRELEHIIHVTSHDLRSPLVNISGYCRDVAVAARELKAVIQGKNIPENVIEKVNAIVNEDIPASVKYINAGILRMESLLNGLLKLSRTGSVELEKEELDIMAMVSHIADAVEFQTREAGAGINISELPPCCGDRDQIDQVFSNLIGNALKYLQPGRQGIITVSGKQEEDRVVYCVEDNGIGIAPENQEKIFGIFQQADKENSGDGLGLAIVKKIMERHDGGVWLESEPGRGSRFFISLPA